MGIEQQMLDPEKGDKGDQGDQGDQGDMGNDGMDGADGPQGIPGDDGSDGCDILTGSGVPDDGADGKDCDTYIDTDTCDIYTKAGGAWAVTGNLSCAGNVFGGDFVDAVDLTERCTTDKIGWTNQLTFVTPALSIARYRLGIQFEHSQDVASKGLEFRIQVDGVTVDGDEISTDDNQLDRFEPYARFAYFDQLAAGSFDLDLDFKLQNLAGMFEGCLRDARIELWRVS